jgi:uncharacterized OB-fold protein
MEGKQMKKLNSLCSGIIDWAVEDNETFKKKIENKEINNYYCKACGAIKDPTKVKCDYCGSIYF